jgi:IS5 family transposase
MGQAKRFSSEIASGVKRCSDALKQAALEGLKRGIDEMMETVKKVVHQSQARVFGGDTHVEGKIVLQGLPALLLRVHRSRRYTRQPP